MSALAVHIFRRDLRLSDNTALIGALNQGHTVLPCFIIDPRQFDPHPYLSLPGRNFLVESLRDLDSELRALGSQLFVFRGQADAILARLCAALDPKLVTVNEDYTPFSKIRDAQLATVAAQHGARFEASPDILLNNPRTVLTTGGTPYTVFTPYHRNAATLDVPAPRALPADARWYTPAPTSEISFGQLVVLEKLMESLPKLPRILLRGGRREGVRMLTGLSNRLGANPERDIPSRAATSLLSAHHKFGTISPRESYAEIRRQFGGESALERQLYWRDFFTAIAFHFPHVFGGAFRRKYDAVEWSEDPDAFQAWCAGETGFPIVDAGMRQLNATGFMHNRVRMIVASFLTKDLHLSWQLGERYFATRLIDYDPAVNNGSWQWSASTGCDAQPYFRIFNPWLQQKRFDPEALYVKEWIPELRDLSPKQIHGLADRPHTVTGYPAPIVDHREQASRAIRMFEDL